LKVTDTETQFCIIHEPRYFKGFFAFLIGLGLAISPMVDWWNIELKGLLKALGILIVLTGFALIYAGIKMTVYRDRWYFSKTEKILTHRSGHRKSTYDFSELQKIRYSEVPSPSLMESVGGGAVEILLENGKSLDIIVCEDRQVTRKIASQLGAILKGS